MTFITKRQLAVTVAACLLAGAAQADTIRVGVIAPFSGPFAIWGQQFQQAIEVYQAEHGTEIAGHTIEFLYRDTGGVNPDQTRALAQELLIREGVDYLSGLVFTPNALAVAELATQSETPTVIMNAATSMITTQSDYFLRTGFTLWQVTVPMADWALAQGITTAVTAVTDYGPGIDAENAFRSAFEAGGGTVLDAIRMPIQTTDFAPFMQRVRDEAPAAVFGFLPAGPPTYAFTRAYNENGLREAGITFLGTGETDETTLEALGEPAMGLHTAYHYSAAHDSEMNHAFTARLAEMFPGSVANLASVGAYDGAALIYHMVEVAGSDGPAAMQAAMGYAWESPRGPVSIDPATRHITQNVYIRVVDRDAEGRLINREIDTIEAVPDLGLSQ